MNKYEKSLIMVRNKIMADKKIVCTGNPENPNCIAYGVAEVFPNTIFLHKSMGVDLTKDFNKIKNILSNNNIFINASYIGPFIQTKLLKLAHEQFKMGHIFNIGSTNEYDKLGEKTYCESKLNLRETSLELNNFRIQTTHILLGGIDLGESKTNNWIKPLDIAQLILWITKQYHTIPLIALDQNKKPW